MEEEYHKIYNKTTTIRQTRYLIKNIDWNTKKLHLKDTKKDRFIKYWSRLDMQFKHDTAQFYYKVNSLLKYKLRRKIVKGIRHEEEIIMGIQKDKIVLKNSSKNYTI